MNYFAHAKLVLPLNRPLTTAGAILPDLIRYAGARRNHVPLVWQDRPDTDGGSSMIRDQFEQVTDGVQNHLEADASFHTSKPFLGALHALNRFIQDEARELADHWTRWLLPHLTVELVLDRLLVRADPVGADLCYAAMDTFRRSEAFGPVCACYRVNPLVTGALLKQWVANRRLHSYDSCEGIVRAIERTLSRHGRPVIANGQAAAFARLLEQAEEIVGDPLRMLPLREEGRQR